MIIIETITTHISHLFGHCYFPRVAVTNYSKTGGLKRKEFIIAKSLRLEVRNQGVGRVGFLETLREKTSHVSLLTSGGSMLIPWFVTASLSSLSLSSDGILFSAFIFVSLFSLYKDTSHRIRVHFNPYDLILTNYICKECTFIFPNKVTFTGNRD